MKTRRIIGLFILSVIFQNYITASDLIPDTTKTIDIEQIVVVASPKENLKLRRQPISSSIFSAEQLQNAQIHDINSLSYYIPNFFMPSYGSRQTSAIYIRGVGARINTPAVALYSDNIPIIDKSAYTIPLFGVNRIDVLRGPQGTLYGRNAMGGILRIYTEDPFFSQGTKIQAGASTRDGGAYLSALTSHKFSDKIAFSLGASYKYRDGIFRNDTLGKKTDGGDEASTRFRLIYKPSNKWKLDLSGSYEYVDQNTYPYYYTGTTLSIQEPLPDIVNHITANRENTYRRNSLTTGLMAEYKAPYFTISSITSYQYLKDRFIMDQDFICKDYYQLEQRQTSNAFTQEFVLKSHADKRWEWTAGLFGMWQNLYTIAPVNFYSDGVGMLNGILSNILPDISYTNPMSGQPLTMQQNITLTDSHFCLGGQFRTPVLNGASYFQTTLHRFLHPSLSLTMGLRLDYEHQALRYYGGDNSIAFLYTMQMIRPASLNVTPMLQGLTANDYTRLLPKISLQYQLKKDRGNVYAIISGGHRSGGYNIQMFSDVMRSDMQAAMVSTVKYYCDNLLTQQAQTATSPTLRNMFLGIKQAMDSNIPQFSKPDVAGTLRYKPEYCWNYEMGAHFNFFERMLTCDLAAFFVDTRQQQISRFTDSGMGRIMVNAGNSHSCGAEISLRSSFFEGKLSMGLNYGYTHATFHHYDGGAGHDYTGNYIPYIPTHNTGILVDYTVSTPHNMLKAITFGANLQGAGRIYWTESNNAYQDFYATLGAHVLFDFNQFNINLWGKNLTQNNYYTFYFESTNRGFCQKCYPLQLGIDLQIKL